MKISIIVLTYNRSDALLAVLRSLSEQCNSEHEVLIADDGSKQDQVEMLFEHCPKFACPVRHVWHPDVGFTAAAARNLAAHFAKGEYLIFLDGDCIPNKLFIAQHMLLAENGVFVNGSRVLLSKTLTKEVLEREINLPHCSALFWLRTRLRGDCNKLLHLVRWPLSFFRIKKNFQWRGIRSCNLGIWRHDFVSINGFDETFKGWGHEDADFALRLSHLGIHRKNGFLATEVFHLWHQESKRDSESVNKKRVMARMNTHLILAEKGFRELDTSTFVKLTQLQ